MKSCCNVNCILPDYHDGGCMFTRSEIVESPTQLDLQSKATTTNPKDLAAKKKVSLSLVPSVLLIHAANAMGDGAIKYGPYNWRDKEVVAHIYVDAAIRHILSWFEGEEKAQDSEVHHLGHAAACLGILLDAQAMGKLKDDRPKGQGVASRLLEELAK